MPVEEKLNKILKEMWRLDEKVAGRQPLEADETDFYNLHLETIQKYYNENGRYWKEKKPI